MKPLEWILLMKILNLFFLTIKKMYLNFCIAFFSVQFVFEEPDAAKYVWKMCVLQHTFYKMHQVRWTVNN